MIDRAPRKAWQEWRLLLLLLLCYVYFLPRFADWSQASRVAVVLAVVNQGRLEIDDYAGLTGDYADFNGHRYSDKAPGPALFGVPVYAATRTLLASPGGQRLIERLAQGEALRGTLKPGAASRDKVEFALAQAVVTWAIISIPAAVLGVCVFRVLLHLTGSEAVAVVATLGYALGSSAFAYAGAFYSHQLTAALLFGSFGLLWKARRAGPVRLLVVGLLMGMALISEYPTALIVGGLGLYALVTTRRWTTAMLLGLGMAPPLLLMAAHNLLIFGTPLPVGYVHSTLWQSEHQTGFFSLSAPTAEAFWGITFSPYRGLFFVSPFLLLGPVGLGLLARRPALRAEAAVCGWSAVSLLLVNSSTIMWSGGYAVGPRYLVPMLPFLTLGVGIAMSHWWQSSAFRGILGALLAWSLVVTWSLTIGGQQFPTYDPQPLWNLAWPALARGDIARNLGTLAGLTGWWSLLPLAASTVLLIPWPTRTTDHVAQAPAGTPRESERPSATVGA